MEINGPLSSTIPANDDEQHASDLPLFDEVVVSNVQQDVSNHEEDSMTQDEEESTQDEDAEEEIIRQYAGVT